jgi:hypothetical protein
MRLGRFELRAVEAATVLLFGFVLVTREVRAESSGLSPYEAMIVKDASARVGASGVIVTDPEGKLIERVDIVIVDVFDEHDPVPDVANVVHTKTRDFVIEQELLFAAGEPYSARRADESARNLRKIRQLSLVLVLALQGSAPDRVRVLVITKDVWSLRLNWSLEASAEEKGVTINRLVIQPTEENFLGTHTIVGANYTLDPGTYSLGALLAKKRLWGSDIEFYLAGGVIFGRATGKAEGSYGLFTYGAPIRTTSDRWGWGTGIAYNDSVVRRYDEGKVERFDATVTPSDDALPIEYHSERFVGGVEVVRSFGGTNKYDLSLGAEADRTLARYQHRPGADPRAEQELIDEWLPVNDTRISPFVQLRTHIERYHQTFNLETLALQENYRLGPEVLLRAYPASSAAGSTRDLIGLTSGVSYTTTLGDGLARAVVENTVEYEAHGDHNALFRAVLHVATPRLDFGRFVADGVVADRYENYLNRYYGLGGDTRLRGYPAAGFQGSLRGTTLVAVNPEFRTDSVDILSMHTGLAAFYDLGAAADGFGDLSFLQSLGVGLRILFPYFDRTVFRIDWGFPLTPGYATFPGAVYVAFGQAFPMPELETPTVMDPEFE